MLFPTGSGAVQAEEAGTQATLKVQPILSVALDAAVQLEVTPTEEGSFSASSAKLEVSTNNETGYSLYLATANGKSTLKSLNPAITAEVQAVTGEVTATGFGANTWGYNLGQAATEETIYQAVPTTTGEPQVTTTGPTTGDGTVAADVYSLNFGAKVDADLPSGTYGNEVVVSVVTNPEYVPTLSRISNMQDITPEICAKSAENETARLMDKRDNKLYWVTKLKDGNCWMTQNLDYDIPAGGITGDQAAKTDLSDGRTWATGDPSSSNPYPAQATTTEIYYNDSSTGTYSYDPGLVVVSGTEFVPYESRPEGTDEHQLVGNYYQWNAATAGTGALVSQKGEDATDSICPKGWQLPTLTGDTSAYNLMTKYPDIFSGLALEDDNTGTATEAATQDPLFFGYTGRVYLGAMGGVGQLSFYWLSTLYSENNAYSFGVAPGMATASSWSGRYGSLSIRCLAPSA